MGTDRRTVAEHHQFDNGLPVNGMGHGLANQFVIERLLFVIGGHDDLTGGGARIHLEALILGHLGGLLRSGDIADDIDVSGFERSNLCTRITNKLEGDFIQIGQGGIPVFFVARHLHSISSYPGDKLERAGADWLAGGVFIALLRQHDGITFRHVGDKQGIDILEGQYQRIVVRCFDFFDSTEKFRVRILGVLGGVALQIPFGRRGVERLSVVEGNALAQLKGIAFAVRGNSPGSCQAGHKCPVAVDLDQTFVDVGKNDTVDGCGRIGRGIQPRRLGRLADN